MITIIISLVLKSIPLKCVTVIGASNNAKNKCMVYNIDLFLALTLIAFLYAKSNNITKTIEKANSTIK